MLPEINALLSSNASHEDLTPEQRYDRFFMGTFALTRELSSVSALRGSKDMYFTLFDCTETFNGILVPLSDQYSAFLGTHTPTWRPTEHHIGKSLAWWTENNKTGEKAGFAIDKGPYGYRHHRQQAEDKSMRERSWTHEEFLYVTHITEAIIASAMRIYHPSY